MSRVRSAKPWLPAALLAAAMVLVAGCGSGSGGPSRQVKDSIEYFSSVQVDVQTLDPATGTTSGLVSGPLWIALYDTLVNVAADGTVEPRLATSVTGDADSTRWTVTLRPGLIFTDGTPLNAEAVAAHWRRLADPELGSAAFGPANDLAEITVTDSETLVVTLAEPDAHWPVQLASTALGLVPSPTAIEQYGDQYGTSPQTTVGAGPYTLTEWRNDDRMVLTRNEDYWNADQVGFREIVYRIMPDPALRYNAFTTGEGDILAMSAPGEELNLLREEGYTEVAWQSMGALSIAFNTRGDRPTHSRKLREALVAAVDIESTIGRAAPGAEPAFTLFPESSPFYAPLRLPFGDKQRAQQLVNEYLAETGQSEVRLAFITNQQFSLFAQAFKQEWDQIDGLNVEIEVLQSVLDRSRERDFDLTLSRFGGGVPRAIVDRLLSTEEATTNLTGISDPELDEALRRYVTTTDFATQRAAMEEVQRILTTEQPDLWAHRMVGSYFAREGVTGLTILTDGSLDFASLRPES